LQWLFGVGMEMDRLISDYLSLQWFRELSLGFYISSIVLALLVFITLGTIYISYVDFKDKRRRDK